MLYTYLTWKLAKNAEDKKNLALELAPETCALGRRNDVGDDLTPRNLRAIQAATAYAL